MGWSRSAGLAGRRNRLHQRAHLFRASLADVAQRHGHHDRDRQTDTGGHFGNAADEVLLEAEVAIDAVVDPLQRAEIVKVLALDISRSTAARCERPKRRQWA